MSKHAFPLKFELGQIDCAAGVIRGVSLCTEGPAKGHGVMCDKITLQQLKSCAEQYSGGLKVKMTHAGDAGDIVGYITALRIEGNKLKGDLNLLQSATQREYVLELASKIPDTFGLSVAFSGPTEEVGGMRCARCSEIYSCDLVSEPAANPDGLFAAVDAGAGGSMTPEQIAAAVKAEVTTALAEFAARVAELEKGIKVTAEAEKLAAVTKQVAELSAALETAKTELATKIGDSKTNLELTAKAVAQEFARHTGRTSVPADLGGAGANPPAAPSAVDAFISEVETQFKACKSQSRSLSAAIAKNPAGYAEFRKSGKAIKYVA